MKRRSVEVYEKIYSRSPVHLKNALSRLTFALANKPSVRKSNQVCVRRFPYGYRGAMVISADFELGWGWRYSKNREDAVLMADRARENFSKLLQIFDHYDVPITWAVVGHLFLRSCTQGSHRWMHRIPYFENKNWTYRNGDWYDADPRTHWRNAPAWYAPDLIDMILNSKVRHEIGCHTFSHTDFSYENCPQQVADDEMKACVVAARSWGIELKSFVFPGGTYGNFEVLKKYGISTYRMKTPHELAYPEFDQYGMVVLPSSSGFGNNGLGWSKEYWISRLRKYIKKAVATRTVCHFWFHPSIDEWFLKSIIPDIVRYAAEQREKNLLWIATMTDVADSHKRLTNRC